MMLATFSALSSRRALLPLALLLFAIGFSLYRWRVLQDTISRSGLLSGTLDSSQVGTTQHPDSENQTSLSPHDTLHKVQNRTLGFQEIKVISLPDRTDRHDGWAVTASLTGFDYDLVDGVDASSISNRSLPFTMHMGAKHTACWRAHMNVLQDIVHRGVATTLVFEDDADWDVALKSQLVQLARGSRWLLNASSANSTPSHPESNSPYGPDWDFIWLGHCGARADPWDPRRFVIPYDRTVEPAALRKYGASPDMYHWENAQPPGQQTRLVMSQYYGVCTASYAISLNGARKALYHLSIQPYNAPVDWGYSDMCNKKKSGFTCIGAYPPIIGVHRPAGSKAGWSDIEGYEGESETSFSERVVFSTRMNLDRLLRGERIMRSSDGVAEMTGVAELDVDEIGSAVGHEETIEIGPGDATY